MRLPASQVYDILMSDPEFTSLVDPDHIFTIEVPESKRQPEHAPLVRIVEISDYSSGFANNRSVKVSLTVQVDLWTDDLDLLEAAEAAQIAALEKVNWIKDRAFPVAKDPDITPLYMRSIRYSTDQFIKIK